MLGARERFRVQGERDLALAHTTAAFTRAKVLQRLDHYLRPRGERLSVIDQLKAMKARGAPISMTVQKRRARI
nr:hypothetical protein [uncultured organism]